MIVMQREYVLCQHFPSRVGWGEQVRCLCQRQFPTMRMWATHALDKIDREA
jgi:hypothetical protein